MADNKQFQRLFPRLASGVWVPLNLDEEARKLLGMVPSGDQELHHKNPWLSATGADALVSQAHRRSLAQYSYGGYLENRSTFLKGSYLEENGFFLHLGVDFSVPVGTEVAAYQEGYVTDVFDNGDHDHGWGPRVVLKLTQQETLGALIFGHLEDIRVTVGQRVKPDTILGVIGSPPGNGNWWPHLHLQAMSLKAFSHQELDNFQTLEGYGHPSDLASLKSDYPYPLVPPCWQSPLATS